MCIIDISLTDNEMGEGIKTVEFPSEKSGLSSNAGGVAISFLKILDDSFLASLPALYMNYLIDSV